MTRSNPERDQRIREEILRVAKSDPDGDHSYPLDKITWRVQDAFNERGEPPPTDGAVRRMVNTCTFDGSLTMFRHGFLKQKYFYRTTPSADERAEEERAETVRELQDTLAKLHTMHRDALKPGAGTLIAATRITEACQALQAAVNLLTKGENP